MIGNVSKIALVAVVLLLVSQAALAYTISGVVKQGGRAVNGAGVELRALDGALLESAKTNANGSYSVKVKDIGVYRISASYSGYGSSKLFRIAGDKTVNFSLQASIANISGIVGDASGKPIAGAVVRAIKGKGQLASTVTDAEGKYSLRVVDRETYKVVVYAAGYPQGKKEVRVSGSPIVQDFTLADGTKISAPSKPYASIFGEIFGIENLVVGFLNSWAVGFGKG